jgi:hypothetical protein
MALQSIVGNSPIPTAASEWRKASLDCLNAKYDRHVVTNFMFNGLVLPDEVQASMAPFMKVANCVAIDAIATELESVNNSDVLTPEHRLYAA